MIDGFGADVRVAPSPSFSVTPDYRERGAAIADRVQDHFGLVDRPTCHVEVLSSPPAHSGLGSGTQLSLAITECLVRFVTVGGVADRQTMIRISDRGRRSAVGVHGYFDGGFIAEGCDAAKTTSDLAGAINSVDRRLEIPRPWRVAVLLPRVIPIPIAGETEQNHFAKLCPASSKTKGLLTRTLLNQIIPSVEQSDFVRFAESLEDYNYHSGELFRDVQGGAYNGEIATGLVEAAKHHGGRGVGQSSWGPGVFAWFEDSSQADDFVCRIVEAHPDIQCQLMAPRSRPRTLVSRL